MAEQAKRQAIEDIKAELKKSGKCFLAFRSKLNPVMEELVNEQINEQIKLKK